VTRWIQFLVLPLLGICAAAACPTLVANFLPSERWKIGELELIALVSVVVLLPIGVWLYRIAISTQQRLGGLTVPLLYWGTYAWLLYHLEQKYGFLFPASAMNYVEGSAPLLGVMLGYTISAFTQRPRSPV
jgi:hypothetical protein